MRESAMASRPPSFLSPVQCPRLRSRLLSPTPPSLQFILDKCRVWVGGSGEKGKREEGLQGGLKSQNNPRATPPLQQCSR